jgi:hypothetical protein
MRVIANSRWLLIVALLALVSEATAQTLTQSERRERMDSALTSRYNRNKGIDTAYILRPQTKWTVVGRINVSGAKIETEGVDNGLHFNSEMKADYKSTLSVAVSYLGLSLSASLNPAKLMGKYRDYELNFNSYGKRFGFDIIYQNAKNFTGWHDHDGMERIELPADMLKVKTLNVNAFYVFNSSRFSYPAAFSQSYIQRRSAGSFVLAASGMGQRATHDWEQGLQLKMTNIGIGAGYGYNYVPKQGWLLHLSLLPTFIFYSKTSLTYGDNRVALHYHFPEYIITSRAAVVRQWGNKFLGLSMVFNYTNIGDKADLAVYNTKWRIRTFFGLRI